METDEQYSVLVLVPHQGYICCKILWSSVGGELLLVESYKCGGKNQKGEKDKEENFKINWIDRFETHLFGL